LDELAKSPSLLKVAGFLCVTLIVVGAAAVVFNELRTAGVWRRRRRARAAAQGVGAAQIPAPAASALGAAAPDAVTELLRQLVACLMQTGRLGNPRSLTHRELIVCSRLDSEEQRSVLASVAATAERTMYGGEAAPDEQPAALIASGRMLLVQLGKAQA
jgi:hypothetical protein